MRLLVWQQGRFGAGPRYAAALAQAMGAALSLSAQAELLRGDDAPRCELAVPTYRGLASLLAQLPLAPVRIGWLVRRLRPMRLDAAICAMPAPLDLLMAVALRWLSVPIWVVVHDADIHPGDGFPLQMWLQRALCRRAAGLIALSAHVRDRLIAQGFSNVVLSHLPPLAFGPVPPPPRAHGGPLRLLSFGRLLPYKGLDLLPAAWRLLESADIELRVVGQGPETPMLDALRAMPRATVENRWVPEAEVGELLAWADALVLPYREASQSGAAAAALAAGRWVVATRVGGLSEQLAGLGSARLCEPNPGALASAILSLISAPPCVETPEIGQDWQRMAEQIRREIEPRPETGYKA